MTFALLLSVMRKQVVGLRMFEQKHFHAAVAEASSKIVIIDELEATLSCAISLARAWKKLKLYS